MCVCKWHYRPGAPVKGDSRNRDGSPSRRHGDRDTPHRLLAHWHVGRCVSRHPLPLAPISGASHGVGFNLQVQVEQLEVLTTQGSGVRSRTSAVKLLPLAGGPTVSELVCSKLLFKFSTI